AAGAGGLGGGAAVSGPPGGRELDRACPAVGDVARLRAVAAEQRLPAANAAHVVWGDLLAAASRTVSEGLQGLAGCAVGSGVGVVPHQRTGAEVQWMDCLLTVFVLYEMARRLLRQLTGVERAAGTLWEVGPVGGATGDGAARGRVRSVGGGGTPRGRALNRGTGSAAAGDRRGWGDGTVSTAPPHGEGENPVAGDQGGDSGPPGRAAEPPGNAREPSLPAPVSGGVGRDR